ncbi:unnamed protein product [Vicia faba]|uniref:Retrotransposon gag domain-containing protein n=1 Tax=Vicia faba TaxID=3906 RepID=A0AAV0ZD52_VICFA|nr:unnamed protein product [Vicia faba]
MLHYHNVAGTIKCRLFPTNLRKDAIEWYKSLAPGSITCLRNLKNQFISSSTASRRHPNIETALEAIVQRHDETLREFIDRFNREAIQVPCTDHMKRYLLEKGLFSGTKFRKAVGIEPPRTFDALLEKARAYMDYEEREATNIARDPRNRGSTSHP